MARSKIVAIKVKMKRIWGKQGKRDMEKGSEGGGIMTEFLARSSVTATPDLFCILLGSSWPSARLVRFVSLF